MPDSGCLALWRPPCPLIPDNGQLIGHYPLLCLHKTVINEQPFRVKIFKYKTTDLT